MAALEPIGPDLWIANGDCVSFYGFAYPTRSVLVRLRSGDLWLWSPIALEPALQREIDALGPLAHLVRPNKIHHLFLGDWHAAYPAARLWGPASTIRKRDDLPFEAPLTDDAPAPWADDLEQIRVYVRFQLHWEVQRVRHEACLLGLFEQVLSCLRVAAWRERQLRDDAHLHEASHAVCVIELPHGVAMKSSPLQLRSSGWRGR